jgi:hypothetical protein
MIKWNSMCHCQTHKNNWNWQGWCRGNQKIMTSNQSITIKNILGCRAVVSCACKLKLSFSFVLMSKCCASNLILGLVQTPRKWQLLESDKCYQTNACFLTGPVFLCKGNLVVYKPTKCCQCESCSTKWAIIHKFKIKYSSQFRDYV